MQWDSVVCIEMKYTLFLCSTRRFHICEKSSHFVHYGRDFCLEIAIEWVGILGGGTRVHHRRVGSAGLRDLKILHTFQRLKKGGQNSTMIPQR